MKIIRTKLSYTIVSGVSMLTHNDLIKLGDALGHKMTDGLCQGFTGMYAQAALLAAILIMILFII